MTVLLDQFVQSLVDSGLMTADDVQTFVDRLPTDQKPDSAEDLARLLFRDGRLTKFQAQAVYQGKTKLLVLGNYVVRERIGQGGMGHVYEAEHRRMKRNVALKVLPSALMKQPGAVERFQREVRAAARLLHPNIVAAFDADEADGVHFLVMEHVDGIDLAATVERRGPLLVGRALDYVLQAARGLEYAHAEGVVHRDVKPSNLLVDKSGTVKILDMGLARLEQEVGPDDATAPAALTQSGQVMGTIDYMSPEQAEDTHRADRRADVYSLGCTLFYLLTGRPVYHGETLTKKILGHREGKIPSLRTIRRDVPERLDDVFRKMVAKRPDQRHQSMSQVVADLEACRASLEAEVTDTLSLSRGPTGGGDTSADHTAGLASSVEKPPSGDTALEAWLNAELPEPPTALQTAPRKRFRLTNGQIVIGSVAAGLVLILVLLGIVLRVKTPEGTLVVHVNEPDAEISVDGGHLTVKSPSDAEPVEIEVVEGEHTLRVTKGGFETFTEEVAIKSGDKETIRVELTPLTTTVDRKPKAGASQVASRKPETVGVSDTDAGVVRPADAQTDFALEFDGQSSYVFSPASYSGSHPITIEAFVTPSVVDKRRTGVVVGVGLFNLELCVERWRIGGLDGEAKSAKSPSVSPASVNRRVHLAGVWDGRVLGLYVDGLLQGHPASFVRSGPKSTGLVAIGATRNDVTRGFPGTIDEVRISSIARYTENFTPQRRFEPDEHTLALYHFDEGTGDVLHDSSGNGHDGKIVGAKWVRVDEPPATTNWALQFDGKTSYVAMPGLDGATVSASSLEAWVTPEELGAEKSDPNGKDVALYCLGTKIAFRYDGLWEYSTVSDSTARYLRSSVEVSSGQPVHLAGCCDEKEIRFFLNGKLQETKPGMDSPPDYAVIGAFLHGSPHGHFHGTIDEVRISNVARYTEDFTPQRRFEPDEHTMALYHFDEGSGDVLHDSSGNGHDGKIVGAKWVKVDERVGGFAVISDGWTFADPVNLGPRINSASSETGPALSADGLTLFFASNRPEGWGGRDLWMSTRKSVGDPFGNAHNVGPTVNSSSHETSPAISSDGLVLLFASTRPGGQGSYDLWMSTRTSMNDPFGEPVNLGSEVNSVHEDSTPAVSTDGLTLLFRSKAPDHDDGYDLWMSTRKSDRDRFGKPWPLGQAINSNDRESYPNLSSDGLVLFLSRGVAGHYDLWMSTRKSITDPFGEPVNLGPSVNTVDNEISSALSADGHTLIFSSNRPGGEGGEDLWMILGCFPTTKTEQSTNNSSRPCYSPPAIAPFTPEQAKQHQQAWGEHLGVPVEQDIDLGNGGKLTMVLIPPGEFGMGSTTEEQARFLEEARAAGDQWAVDRIPTEGPQHRVRITRPFCLGKYEVTQAQWEAVMGSSPSHFADNPFHPVERVSWDDIQPFLDKLNVAGTRRVPSANGGKSEPSEMTFTLPTEAQWEYACRAGTTTFWHCGDDEATLQEYAWFSVDSRGKTHPVGELQANGFGLHDMHGNVWEWCADYWATDYYAESASNDPSGPSAGSYRVRRGGRWCDHAGHCRSAIRDDASPDYRVGSLGFRLASVLADERAESGASETEGGKPAAHAPEAEASSAEGEAVSPPDTSAWKEVLPSGQGTFRTTPSPASASARFLSSTSTATPSPPSDVSPTPPRVTQRVPQCAPCTTRYRGKNPM